MTDSIYASSKENEYVKADIGSMDIEELQGFMTEELGEKKFRAGQVFQWIHEKGPVGFDEMTNLPKALREKLKETCDLGGADKIKELRSKSGDTVKYLFGLKDGNVIETVLMRYKFGDSVCVSSQVGCRMGCTFCASTLDGLVRDLTPYEMLSQVYACEKETGERVTHVVIMGSGEPLDNYDNVIRFIRLLTDEKGRNISRRNVTLSTCGIVPKMDELSKEDIPLTLAVSLHGPDDETRQKLVPMTKRYGVEEIVKAADRYFEANGRRVTYEYSLVDGVNDDTGCAARLAALLKGRNCHVNLIPVNPIKERKWRPGGASAVSAFKNELEKNGVHVTIRAGMGRDIDAACGQLRKSYTDKHTDSQKGT